MSVNTDIGVMADHFSKVGLLSGLQYNQSNGRIYSPLSSKSSRIYLFLEKCKIYAQLFFSCIPLFPKKLQWDPDYKVREFLFSQLSDARYTNEGPQAEHLRAALKTQAQCDRTAAVKQREGLLQRLILNICSLINRVAGIRRTDFSEVTSNGYTQQFEQGLQQWVDRAEPGEKREQAKNIILEFVRGHGDTLELKDLGLKEFPPIWRNVDLCQRLVSLQMAGNRFITLPPAVGRLTSLQYVSFAFGTLTTLPAEIGRWENLKNINLYNNKLTSIPVELCKLKKLGELTLTVNKLTAVPAEIGQATALRALWLDSNQLTALPDEIGNLSNLTWLQLSGNPLEKLPRDAFEKLPKTCTVNIQLCRELHTTNTLYWLDQHFSDLVTHFENELRDFALILKIDAKRKKKR